jgi:ribosomal silencing factor RsfS
MGREIKAISIEPTTSEGRQEARPALIDANSLMLRVLDKPIRQAQWLPAH